MQSSRTSRNGNSNSNSNSTNENGNENSRGNGNSNSNSHIAEQNPSSSSSSSSMPRLQLTASALDTLPTGSMDANGRLVRRDPRFAHQDHAEENDDARTTMTVETDAPDHFVPALAMEHQPKVGGKFCGCCDYRRAVLILSVVTIFTSLMDMVFLVANVTSYEEVRDDFNPTFDDDELTDAIFDVQIHLARQLSVVKGLEIVFGVVSLCGAAYFRSILLFVGLVGMIAETVLAILLPYQANEEINDLLEAQGQDTYVQPLFTFIVQTLFRMVWVYPSAVLWLEIRRGIMSPRTYPREEFSCCCFYY